MGRPVSHQTDVTGASQGSKVKQLPETSPKTDFEFH